jgi:hypothetical protein
MSEDLGLSSSLCDDDSNEPSELEKFIHSARTSATNMHNNTNANLTEEFKRIFPTREEHMKMILSFYKSVYTKFNVPKMMWEKTEQEALHDVNNIQNGTSLNDIIHSNMQGLDEYMKFEEHKKRTYEEIGKLVELCFAYYVWTLDEKAPFISLPSEIKYRLLTQMLQALAELNDKAEYHNAVIAMFDKWFLDEEIYSVINFYSPNFILQEKRTKSTYDLIMSMEQDLNTLINLLLKDKQFAQPTE